MGCGSSRETGFDAGNGTTSPAASQARLTNIPATSQTPVSQTPLSQSTNRVHSTATSRAALNPTSSTSLPSASSPRHSTARHRHRGVDPASGELGEHYNIPLLSPRPWQSQLRTWSPTQLKKERQEYFDTRVTGQKEVWEALRQVTECIRDGELPTAQGILDAVNVTLPTGHLEDGCYDERGYLYRIPEECLTDPTNIQPDEPEVDGETVVGVPADTKANLSSDTLDKHLSLPQTIYEKSEMTTAEKGKDIIPEDAINLKCRMSDRGLDIINYIGKTETLASLTTRLIGLAQIPKYARIEIFYLGKRLDQKKTLEEQDYLEGHVLNIFVVGAPKEK